MWATSTQPQPPAHLASTQDLIARFQLLPAYDKYVRPHVVAEDPPATPGAIDKGKGKEKELATATPDDGQDGDDDEGGKGDKKKKNTYKHLIKETPGKHSMRKDDYLMTMMQVPPKQRISISQFDQKTQREAFSVSLEGLKAWNVNTLIVESVQAREDRKRRKELKKLAKTNVMPGPLSATSPTAAASANAFAAPTPGSSAGTAPKPTRPPPVQIPNNNNDTPRGGTPRPTPTSAASQQHLIPNPGTPTEKRGKKRDHEEASKMVQQQNRSLSQQNGGGTPRPGALNGNGLPRAIKKQRMDMTGQARDMPVQQQPTPQGV
ncbi:hypothetical protein FIBSPDRAFT_918524 [Athelia psychrophila]|uniref:Mediator of RNA polymerase II transcription subunit 19 n=1 Tax=Athelia psychrophila TaxID=1759441 RepID=A0A166NK65_9AGAM|nr:hypothetical protein FIBSPDRAFT_918524 [Fibularhizoctonia sp. CBS 109695]